MHRYEIAGETSQASELQCNMREPYALAQEYNWRPCKSPILPTDQPIRWQEWGYELCRIFEKTLSRNGERRNSYVIPIAKPINRHRILQQY